MENKTALCRFVREEAEKCRVLVLGDIMLDQYYFSEVKKISPEAPVPVARVIRQKETLGGAGNVAHNLALLGCKTYLAGSAGDDYHRGALLGLLDECAIDHKGLVVTQAPTTTKLRVMGGHQQMIRLDFEDTDELEERAEENLLECMDAAFAAGLDSVIISDYAKGVCTPKVCQYVISLCKQHDIPVIVDPKGTNWEKYTGVDYLTPNLKEINEVVSKVVHNEDAEVTEAAQLVAGKYQVQNLLVTRSEKGMSLVAPQTLIHIPTLAQEVFDVSGAGDTVIAVLALALAGKIPAADAAFMANLAASVVVAKLGTYAISQAELLNVLEKQ